MKIECKFEPDEEVCNTLGIADLYEIGLSIPQKLKFVSLLVNVDLQWIY